jgi:hypothetical protein
MSSPFCNGGPLDVSSWKILQVIPEPEINVVSILEGDG